MRFPTSSGLLCRHSTLLKTPIIIRKAGLISFQSASTLSGIHNGLRDSQRSRPQGFHKSSLESKGSRRGSPRGSRADWTPPTFKMTKGKKDITDTGPKAPSRRSRFNNPEFGFGKKSMVYQMKHGALKNYASKLAGSEDAESRSGSHPGRLSKDAFMRDFDSGSGRGARFPRAGATGRNIPARAPSSSKFEGRQGFVNRRNDERNSSQRPHSSFPEARSEPFASRPSFQPRPRDSLDKPDYSSRFRGSRNESGARMARENWNKDDRGPRRMQENWNKDDRGPREMREDRPEGEAAFGKVQEDGDGGERVFRRIQGGWKGDEGPVRIPRTTAASQFLYGRAVTEAALTTMRRKFYKLYIYAGDNRRGTAQDAALAHLAERKGIEVEFVPNEGLRMLDKMSEGRPHNGCILEASPLPQLPIKSLGPLSEDSDTPGFRVRITHQSSEEEEINGTSDFVPYRLPPRRNPFVLLLDGILDPGNLGSILRTAAFLGVNAVAITKSDSATLTPVALKASAGASEATTLFSVDSTTDFLSRSKEKGWIVYAAVPETKWSRGSSHMTVDRVEIYDPLATHPTLLVVGSEGTGLNRPIRRLADHLISIPGPSGGAANLIDSLNVNVATGILCSAFLRKQTVDMSGVFGTERNQAEPADENEEWEEGEGNEETEQGEEKEENGGKLW